MLLIRSTLAIYRDSALDAVRATTRSAYGFVFLLLLAPLLKVAGIALSPLGMIGGMAASLLMAACAGTYLATLDDTLGAASSRGLSLATLRGNLGRYTSEVLGVAFPIWIGGLILSFVPGPLYWIYQVVVAVAFNVSPEMIGRTRSSGIELLGDSLRWLKDNGPEWFIPQALLLLPIALWRPGSVATILSMFGPQFGFVNAGGALLGMDGPISWVGAFGMVVYIHAMMLFRAALFIRLGRGGRRQRLWKARVGG